VKLEGFFLDYTIPIHHHNGSITRKPSNEEGLGKVALRKLAVVTMMMTRNDPGRQPTLAMAGTRWPRKKGKVSARSTSKEL